MMLIGLLGRNLPQGGGIGSAILWLVILLVIIAGAAAGIYYLRWWMKSHPGGEGEQMDLTLQDLRKMQQEGQLSKQEYESARRVILGKMDQTARGDRTKH